MLELSPEVRLTLTPRAAYARPAAEASAEAALVQAPRAYILYYVLFISLLIGAAASFSATGRITVSLLLSLGLSWMFVPLLHVLVTAALVASVRAPRIGGNRAVALLLKGHAPWSLWLLVTAAATGAFGYAAYQPMVILALVPIALTFRIVHAFCAEVLGLSARAAIGRTLAHQFVTWLIAAVYLDKAVGLVPRVQGWLS